MSKKEPFNPALDAPIALTPDQIEKVAGGSFSRISVLNGGLGSVLGGATTGIVAPPPPPPLDSVKSSFLAS